MSDSTPSSSRFHAAYAGEPPPWDIGRPQRDLAALAGLVRGSVIDLGCGTGEHALLYAARGHEVVGVDAVPAAIEMARAKAEARGLAARFEVGDALDLGSLGRRFDHAVDCGLFHVFDDEERARYVRSLGTALVPGATLHLLCFSELTPGDEGPRRVTQAELRAAFAEGFEVLAIDPAELETNRPEWHVHAWRAQIRRV